MPLQCCKCVVKVHAVFLLPLMDISLEIIDACIWCMFVFLSIVVTV